MQCEEKEQGEGKSGWWKRPPALPGSSLPSVFVSVPGNRRVEVVLPLPRG